jgi:hypothetical protein
MPSPLFTGLSAMMQNPLWNVRLREVEEVGEYQPILVTTARIYGCNLRSYRPQLIGLATKKRRIMTIPVTIWSQEYRSCPLGLEPVNEQ